MKKIFRCFCWLVLTLILILIPNFGFGQSPTEIMVSVDRIKFVGEQNIILKTDVVFYQQISPFWEKLSKINFSPFKMEKMILGERKMFDREKDFSRDFREATFLLSLPGSSPCGIYTIPSFSLGYSYFRGKEEIKGIARSKALKVEKVPILVTVVADKDVLAIAEINTFRLTVWAENYIQILNKELKKNQSGETQNLEQEGFVRWLKSLEVRNQKITDLEKPEFSNFKLLEKKFWSEQQGLVTMEVWEYRFASYELGGKEFPIPGFHVWYLDKSQEEKVQKPREIITPSLAIQVNRMVRPNRRTIEWLKEPGSHPKNNIYYFGYAPLAIGGICFLIFAISVIAGLLRPRAKTEAKIVFESPSSIYKRLSERKTAAEIRNEVFRLFGSILKMPANQALARTTSEMLRLLEQAGFSEKSLQELKACFSDIDKLIQNSEARMDISGLTKLVTRITAVKEISKAVKKRKKFLIF